MCVCHPPRCGTFRLTNITTRYLQNSHTLKRCTLLDMCVCMGISKIKVQLTRSLRQFCFPIYINWSKLVHNQDSRCNLVLPNANAKYEKKLSHTSFSQCTNSHTAVPQTVPPELVDSTCNFNLGAKVFNNSHFHHRYRQYIE